MADQNDWGSDYRRVRPLPPSADETDESDSRRSSPIVVYVMAAIIALVVGGWALWPDGGSPPRPAAASVATIAPPATTVTEEDPAPSAATTTTSTLPPAPALPVHASTEFGEMTWEIVAPTGSSAARWVTNPVWNRSEFVYLAGADRLTLHRSSDGVSWDTVATDFDTSEADELTLIATSDGYLMTGVGFERPRAWRSPDGSRWTEVELGQARPPGAGPIGIYWDTPNLHGSALPGRGGVLWTGAWFGINWSSVLGYDPYSFELLPDDGAARIKSSATDPGTDYVVTVEARDEAVHLTVLEAKTQTIVHDSVSVTGGFRADLVAAALQVSLSADVWRPIGWLIPDEGDPVFLQPDLGGVPTGRSWFTATDDGLVAGTSTFSNSPTSATVVARSADGQAWEVLTTSAFPADAWVAGVTNDTDIAVLVGSMWQTVQLADQVSARTQVGVAFRSENLADWEVYEADFPPGAFSISAIGGGPLGFAAVNFTCPAGCVYEAWLSADGRTWSRLRLPRPGTGSYQIAGVALSTDRVVVIGAAEDGFGILSNVKAWVGTVDG